MYCHISIFHRREGDFQICHSCWKCWIQYKENIARVTSLPLPWPWCFCCWDCIGDYYIVIILKRPDILIIIDFPYIEVAWYIYVSSMNEAIVCLRLAITLANEGFLLIGPFGISFSKIRIKLKPFFSPKNECENVICKMAAITPPCQCACYRRLQLFATDIRCCNHYLGARFKNSYELLKLRALKIPKLYKNHIFQCRGMVFCMEFQRVPLKFHTKYLTHTLKDVDFIHWWKFKSS